MPSSHLCENSGDCGFSRGPKMDPQAFCNGGDVLMAKSAQVAVDTSAASGHNSQLRAAIELHSQAHGAGKGAPRTPLESIQRTCNHSHSIDHLDRQHHHFPA